ncbi:hypothetical protein G7046_g6817 [Stylonectria norvegica]|nr:hypothetical protein G7046_g6817 [Stylonectria norvegica]
MSQDTASNAFLPMESEDMGEIFPLPATRLSYPAQYADPTPNQTMPHPPQIGGHHFEINGAAIDSHDALHATSPPMSRKRPLESSALDRSPSSTSSEESQSKRPKSMTRYSCPYRKRNPLRFNVRDYQTCATQGFSSITLVKRHVMTAHLIHATKCGRCGGQFRTPESLLAHDFNFSCSPETIGPCQLEDGIDSQQEARLRDRRARSQVLQWDTLWKTLFQDDNMVPPPDFEPVIDLAEMIELFYMEDVTLRRKGRGIFGDLSTTIEMEVSKRIEVARRATRNRSQLSIQSAFFHPTL